MFFCIRFKFKKLKPLFESFQPSMVSIDYAKSSPKVVSLVIPHTLAVARAKSTIPHTVQCAILKFFFFFILQPKQSIVNFSCRRIDEH